MSDLLAVGRSGVLAYRDALSTVGENVVNADTEGYAKRRVTLKEQAAPGDAYSLNRTRASLNGVQAVDVQRVWDQYAAQSSWSATADAASAGTQYKWQSTIETTLDDSDTGVGTKLTAVFTSANALAATPSDSTLRQNMLSAISVAAATLKRTGEGLQKVSDSVAMEAGRVTGSVNNDLSALAKVNTALRAAGSGTQARAQLEDQRDSLISSLSSNIGVDTQFTASGSVTLRLNGYSGTELLSGIDSSVQQVNITPSADGRLSLTLADPAGFTTSAAATSGNLAGLVSVAGSVSDWRNQLDDLAANFTTSINTWQKGGLDPTGAAGGDLLSGLTTATITPLAVPGSAIAAASTAADGTVVDNGNLSALAALRGQSGCEASWRGIVTSQALLVSSTKSQSAAADTQKSGALTALDGVAGVNLDSEAAELLRFQQAYSASAKIIQAARETFQTVLSLF